MQDLGADAVTVRVALKTAPLEQWAVAREMRQRIKARFDHEGIEIPFAQRVVWCATATPPVTPDARPSPAGAAPAEGPARAEGPPRAPRCVRDDTMAGDHASTTRSAASETIRTIVAPLLRGRGRPTSVLRPLYPEEDLGPAEERFLLFLVQYWGGPTTYSETRGHPRLRMRHAPFAVTPAATRPLAGALPGRARRGRT